MSTSEISFENCEFGRSFVVQKHDARRLHYDFRLELGGVMKSWAVPKGPSLDPHDKRLAIPTTDHALSYASFEGVIADGHYGAGEVIVWDRGTFVALRATSQTEHDRLFDEGLKNGAVTFLLCGEKLKGVFKLLKMKGGMENTWLLIKQHDAYASKDPVTKKVESVLSKRRLECDSPGFS